MCFHYRSTLETRLTQSAEKTGSLPKGGANITRRRFPVTEITYSVFSAKSQTTNRQRACISCPFVRSDEDWLQGRISRQLNFWILVELYCTTPIVTSLIMKWRGRGFQGAGFANCFCVINHNKFLSWLSSPKQSTPWKWYDDNIQTSCTLLP